MDNIHVVWQKLFSERTRSLNDRYPGYYRALVVETNDPLNQYRVRFKCPELHDFDIEPEDCPWAVSAFDMGGQRASRFSHPCIGDVVWITFEKQHPYGPIWVGFATATRRKFYSYQQIHQITPLSLNDDGRPADKPNDYDIRYLPFDGRPMSHGYVDRYGHMEISSAVGFFPSDHKEPPPPPDHDAIQGSSFDQKRRKPEVNNPDKKYMAKVSKYGITLVLGDQGYYWKKEGDLGEFEGDFKRDEQFETKRWLFTQRLLNENENRTDQGKGDQRRFQALTRYGHKIEARDVGWGQQGPIESKSRQGEFGPSRVLSKEMENDFRWIKLRTKGGMLFQAYDKGFHPQEDVYIKRHLLEEAGPRSEKEDEYWKDKDARWMRLVTRNGLKFVLDDRGSDERRAHNRDFPRSNGILLKGRRSPAAKKRPARGNPRGFYWEFNENDEANHTMWGSPLGLAIEINDRYQYVMMAASMGKGWVRKWRGLKENEFIGKPLMFMDPEQMSHHLKIDHDNEYIRLKSRGGRGPHPEEPANPTGVSRRRELQQGLEIRDGRKGMGPWVELVDCQHRGFWFSKEGGFGIWRAKKDNEMYHLIDDGNQRILIYNNQDAGKIQIFCQNDVEIVSGANLSIQAEQDINMRCGGAFRLQTADARLTIRQEAEFSSTINAQEMNALFNGTMGGPGAGTPTPGGEEIDPLPPIETPEIIEPEDRGETYNGPFEECPRDEIEHPL